MIKYIALLALIMPLQQEKPPQLAPMYYEVHEGDEWYWMEHQPLIHPRGICAEMHVGSASKPPVWVLTPVIPDSGTPSGYNFGTPIISATQADAEKTAEAYCPTAIQQPTPFDCAKDCGMWAAPLDCSNGGCVSEANIMQMPEPEAMWSSQADENGQKVYKLTTKPDWKCNLMVNDNNRPTMFSVTCVKPEATPATK